MEDFVMQFCCLEIKNLVSDCLLHFSILLFRSKVQTEEFCMFFKFYFQNCNNRTLLRSKCIHHFLPTASLSLYSLFQCFLSFHCLCFLRNYLLFIWPLPLLFVCFYLVPYCFFQMNSCWELDYSCCFSCSPIPYYSFLKYHVALSFSCACILLDRR